jgi:hypothetical protein
MATTTLPTPELMDIDLYDERVLVRADVQQRAAIDTDLVREYAWLYEEGHDLGRLVLFRTDQGTLLLADGFHRRLAGLRAKTQTLPAEVYPGTLRDAILYATRCNQHGKPRTNADKRRCVRTLLTDPEWGQWSDHAIARHTGVTAPFVGTVRRSLETVSSDHGNGPVRPSPTSRTYTDKHGHTHAMNTRHIGRTLPVVAAEAHGPSAGPTAGTGPSAALPHDNPEAAATTLDDEPKQDLRQRQAVPLPHATLPMTHAQQRAYLARWFNIPTLPPATHTAAELVTLVGTMRESLMDIRQAADILESYLSDLEEPARDLREALDGVEADARFGPDVCPELTAIVDAVFALSDALETLGDPMAEIELEDLESRLREQVDGYAAAEHDEAE